MRHAQIKIKVFPDGFPSARVASTGGDTTHAAIKVMAADPGGCADPAELWVARRHGAGVLARLALSADPFLRAERGRHRCYGWDEDHGGDPGDDYEGQTGDDPREPPVYPPACDLEFHPAMVDLGSEPRFMLHVQPAALLSWRERLAAWLADLEAHDQPPGDPTNRSVQE